MALNWKDKVDGEDWVLAEDINAMAHAVQEIDDKKIDKISDISQAGNFGGAYVLNTDGTQGMTPISNTTDGGTIPIRGNDGVIVAGTPTDAAHVANKGYVDDLAATKVDEWEGVRGSYYTLRSRSTSPQGETTTRLFPLYSIPLANTLAMWDSNKRLSTEEPTKDEHCANKKYVDKAVATVQGQLNTLGTFYEVVKAYSTGTIFIEIPTGAMPTAYIESAGFTAQNVDGTLVYSGTANGLYFLDENWMDISFTSFTAPAYIQIPENARQIRVNCEELVPSDVGWDAGPVVFKGAVYFQVKRG